MADFQNPLDQEFIRELYKVKRDAWGDDLTRPRQFNIGRLNADGSVSTVVINGEYNRVWVHQPGKDTGDAVQAISTLLDSDDMTPYRPVMVKIIRGELVIVGKAIESANYDAQTPVAPQRAINRLQYNVALITPSRPDTSFYAEYRGGIFQLNNVAYRVTDVQSSDFSGTVPGSDALSVKVELDPITGTWHETTGSSFTFSSMNAAYKNGDLDTARTFGRYLIGWIRLYDGQTSIELDDILPAEYMLDIIDDHAALNNLGADDHTQYVHKVPGTNDRNIIQSSGDFRSVSIQSHATQTEPLLDFFNPSGTLSLLVTPDGDIDTHPLDNTNTRLGISAGWPTGNWNTMIGNSSGNAISTGFANTFLGYSSGNSDETGRYNIGIGYQSYGGVAGRQNVAIGRSSLSSINDGDDNVAIGYEALFSNVDGNKNIAIGTWAGFNHESGDGNVFIGYSSGGTSTTFSNKLYLHNTASNTPLIYGEFDTGRLEFNSSNGVGNTTINGTQVSANYDLGLVGDGVLAQKETTTPTADTDYGKTYPKADNKLYFQDGAGVERELIRGQISTEAESDMLIWDAVNGYWKNWPILKQQKEPVGFEEGSRVKSTPSFDNVTRTFTLTHIQDYTIWDNDNVPTLITGDLTRQISDDEAQHYIYYQNGALTSVNAPDDDEIILLISELALVAIVYWNGTDGIIEYLGEERHGTQLDGATHLEFHKTRGTWYFSGLALANFDIDGSGNDDSNAHFSVADGVVYDEDIQHNATNANQPLSPIAELPIYYKTDANNWRRFWITEAWVDATVYSLGDQIRGDDSYYQVTTGGTSGGVEPTWAGNTEPGDTVVDNTVTWTCIGSPRGNARNFIGGNYRLAFNEFVGAAWQQTEVSNGNFVLVHVFATNNLLDNQLMVAIQGQNEYSTIVSAREGATEEVSTLSTTGLPFTEFLPVATIIYQTSNGYNNESKARTRTTDTGNDYVDFRKSAINSTGSTASDHSGLSSLGWTSSGHIGTIDTFAGFNGGGAATNYTESNYALLDGRAGGQSLSGDTASGGDLTLQSTAHATKGAILLDTNSWIDGVKNALFLNTETPTTLNANSLVMGRTAFSASTVSIDQRSWFPTFKQTLYRTTGSGYAYSMFDGWVQNDTTTINLNQIGVFGNLVQGGTPLFTYMYFSSIAAPAYNNANLFLHESGNVSVGVNNTADTAALHVGTPSDQIQQIIRAHSTQTNPLAEWHANGDTALVSISGKGKISVTDNAAEPPLNITERSAAPSTPASGDIYLDDGTNTASGDPGWRRYTGAVWEDISAGAGGGGGSSPKTLLEGMELYRQSNAILAIRTGTVSHYGTLIEKATDTQLDLGTAGNWIGGSSLEPTSGWVHVYIKSDGTLLLSDKHPNIPTATAPVADMRVNVASGLDLTSVPYDAGTTGDSVTAGMYALFYSDATFDTGSDKIATGSSLNILAVALITATTAGAATGTLTLEANHEIYINDNDYILIVEAGDLLYRDVAGTYYRHIGAWWNDGSDNLLAKSQYGLNQKPKRATYTLNEATDYSTTVGTPTDIDSTNLSLTITTSGGDAMVFFHGSLYSPTGRNFLEVTLDGIALGGNNGILGAELSAFPPGHPYSFTRLLTGLMPGTHTVNLQWWVEAAQNLILYAGAGASFGDIHPQFGFMEI